MYAVVTQIIIYPYFPFENKYRCQMKMVIILTSRQINH